MDKLDADQQIRAVALEAAARVVTENLKVFINPGNIPSNTTNARFAIIDLADGLEEYVRSGQR